MTISDSARKFGRYEFAIDELPFVKKFWKYITDKAEWSYPDTDRIFNFGIRQAINAGEAVALFQIINGFPEASNLEKAAFSAPLLVSMEGIKYLAHRYFKNQNPDYGTEVSHNRTIGE